MQIAIDGPAGSGKSTAGYRLARRLDYLYIDTGALYRAVALKGLHSGISFSNDGEIIRIADSIDIDIQQDWSTGRGYRVILDGQEETPHLFTPQVDGKVSIVARIGKVREILTNLERKMARNRNVVMAGRDIGSNVLTYAEVKIFLTADAGIRAERRLKELEERGQKEELDKIRESIIMRDRIDSTRRDNPLIKTPDAVEVDCSRLTIEQMVDRLEEIVAQRIENQENTGLNTK